MDVLVSHHPEYVALVYGAMKFLFVSVVNHQKLLTRLCPGLSDVAFILPRARLLAQLYPSQQIKGIIMAIYTNILRFLVQALEWYQESRPQHLFHAFTRPVELRYDEILATISALSRSLTDTALASSHAEQRDMHINIIQQSSGQNKLSASLEHLSIEISHVKKLVVSHRAFHATARVDLNEQISGVQLKQLVANIVVTDPQDPINALRASLFISGRRDRKRLLFHEPQFWLDTKIQYWNRSDESSLVIMNGARRAEPNLQCFAANAVALLQSTEIPVIWALSTSLRGGQTSTIDLLKYLIPQAISCNKSIHNSQAMAARLTAWREAESEEDYGSIFLSVLEGIPLLYMMVDLKVLSRNIQTSAREFWPRAFLSMFSKLSKRGISTVLRVALVSCDSPLPRNSFRSEFDDYVVHVDSASQPRNLTHRPKDRGQVHSEPRNTASVNLEAIGEARQTRGRSGQAARRRRRD